MPNITGISQYPLKVIFAVHLALVIWILEGGWCPKAVMFYNLLFFICLLWAVHNLESDEPIQFALIVNVFSIFFDIVTLSVWFPPIGLTDKFSASMAIINMIVRIVTSFYLLRIGQARGGDLTTMFAPSPAMGFERQGYEDMSQPVPQNADFAGI